MALINCGECGREVSDKAPACPSCGAPIAMTIQHSGNPQGVSLLGRQFKATKPNLIRHAIKAIQSLNWRVDSADESTGLVSFTTGMTWGSWSGASGTIYLEEVSPNTFEVSGNAKQNLKGGQIVALNIGNEANNKVSKVLEEMRRLVR